MLIFFLDLVAVDPVVVLLHLVLVLVLLSLLKMSCGFCGGDGCSQVPGTAGASDCCPSTILTAGQNCGGQVVAPCIVPCKLVHGNLRDVLLATIAH